MRIKQVVTPLTSFLAESGKVNPQATAQTRAEPTASGLSSKLGLENR